VSSRTRCSRGSAVISSGRTSRSSNR
jgi:hypothetical protein